MLVGRLFVFIVLVEFAKSILEERRATLVRHHDRLAIVLAKLVEELIFFKDSQ